MNLKLKNNSLLFFVYGWEAFSLFYLLSLCRWLVCSSVHVCLPAVCPSNCLSVCWSVCLSVCFYVCLSVCLSVCRLWVFVCLSLRLSVCLFVTFSWRVSPIFPTFLYLLNISLAGMNIAQPYLLRVEINSTLVALLIGEFETEAKGTQEGKVN